MTGADGGAGLGARPELRWDVALSFAGAQRDYVGQVAAVLKARGVRCFYDADEQVRLWGTYLSEELPRIYAQESTAVVVFVSADYAGRDWTRLERRAAFSRAVAEAGVYVLPARFDDSELPGLLPDVAAIDLRRYTPEQFAGLVVAKLADLAISPSPLPREVGIGPTGRIRVREADPRRLGVHATISVPGVPDEVPPEYVPRDADAAEFGIRAKLAAAAERGGFVLLVGGSSVGKTRCAVEAVRELLPEWWLAHPAGPREIAALTRPPSPRTVVWLDELQRYLDGEHGLIAAVIRALLNAQHPTVIIGTLWPEWYTAYTALPPPGGPDPHAWEREVVELADIIRISPEFSPAELDRARAAAARDRRLAVALESAGYGLTQTLAAAPQLVARWEDARTANPYAWAVLTTALDAARLGARAPLSPGLLRAAAPGYCTSQQQAEAPENWFEQALAYATGKLHGAACALSPVGAGMGQIAGYALADYLIQHASLERRYAQVPASAWDAIISHIRNPADAARLADSARNRLLYRYAIPLYRYAADSGNRAASWWLARLLANCGDLDGLREQADAGHHFASELLAGLLVGRVDLNELRERADAGDQDAAWQLADLLADRGDLDGAAQILRARADVGDPFALGRLARLLAMHGDLDGVAQIERARAEAGDRWALKRLADLLAKHGDLDRLREQADAGDRDATLQLTGLLAKRGDLDELRALADAGHLYAAAELARLLAARGDLDELRARANSGNKAATERLAELLAARGEPDEAAQILRARADTGDQDAAWQLADLLAKHGDLDRLRERADAGDRSAARWLARLLADRGDLDELRERADADDEFASRELALRAPLRGDLDELRARADTGNKAAAERLAGLLADRGDLDELRARADTGDQVALGRLAGLLADRGDLDELRALADTGDLDAALRLAGLLAQRGDLDGAAQILRTRADAGDPFALGRLVGLLADRGDLDELRAWADTGNKAAAKRLVGLLVQRGDLDELRARVCAGDGHAAERIAEVLEKQGRGGDAERLRRFGLNPDGSIASA